MTDAEIVSVSYNSFVVAGAMAGMGLTILGLLRLMILGGRAMFLTSDRDQLPGMVTRAVRGVQWVALGVVLVAVSFMVAGGLGERIEPGPTFTMFIGLGIVVIAPELREVIGSWLRRRRAVKAARQPVS